MDDPRDTLFTGIERRGASVIPLAGATLGLARPRRVRPAGGTKERAGLI